MFLFVLACLLPMLGCSFAAPLPLLLAFRVPVARRFTYYQMAPLIFSSLH